MTQPDGGPSLRILPDSVGGTTEVTESTTPTTLIDEPEETIIEASGTPRNELTVNIQSTDSSGQTIGVGDLRVYEDGNRQEIESVEFSAGELDLVFVFDDTGSMADEISAMQSGVKDLTTSVAGRDIDARYALVSFKDEPEVDVPFTRDAQELKGAVDQMQAKGGGDPPEDNFGAIMTGLELDLREAAQTVFVDITDASSHYRGESVEDHPHMNTLASALDSFSELSGAFDSFTGDSDYIHDEVASALAEANVDFVAVAPDFDHPECSIKTLAGSVDGLWTDISKRSFDRVLDHVTTLITGTYRVSYYSAGDAGGNVPVRVEYDDPSAGTLSDTVQVHRPSSGPARSERESGVNTGQTGQDSTAGPSQQSTGAATTSGVSEHSTDTSEAEPRYCPSCGHDLQSYATPSFCPECGATTDPEKL